MRRSLRLSCISVSVFTLAAAASDGSIENLGGYPLCEASAAVFTACPQDLTMTCLLVGDNERRGALFSFPFDGHRLDVSRRRTLELQPILSDKDDFELSDIEALTQLGSGEVLIYGSHSRNKDCKRRKKRRRFVGAATFRDGRAVGGRFELVRTKRKFDLYKAFPADVSGDLLAVRETVEAAERRAEAICDDKSRHESFNIEGVVAIPGPEGDQVWVGLRAPLVNGNAVLLRQNDLTKLRFDRVRLIDLQGRGIRDLSYHRGWIWGLAGPVADNPSAPFRLWRFRVGALAGSGTIAVDDLGAAPNGAEGLAIWGNTAVVVIDGMAVGRQTNCETDATYDLLRVPW